MIVTAAVFWRRESDRWCKPKWCGSGGMCAMTLHKNDLRMLHVQTMTFDAVCWSRSKGWEQWKFHLIGCWHFSTFTNARAHKRKAGVRRMFSGISRYLYCGYENTHSTHGNDIFIFSSSYSRNSDAKRHSFSAFGAHKTYFDFFFFCRKKETEENAFYLNCTEMFKIKFIVY